MHAIKCLRLPAENGNEAHPVGGATEGTAPTCNWVFRIKAPQMAEDDTYLHELARPSIRIVSDCYAASTDALLQLTSSGAEGRQATFMKIDSL